jgi:predicted outer membrane repeat protein
MVVRDAASLDTTSYGGGALSATGAAHVFIEGSNFTSNTAAAPSNGGAVSAVDRSQVTLSEIVFDGNAADGRGSCECFRPLKLFNQCGQGHRR